MEVMTNDHSAFWLGHSFGIQASTFVIAPLAPRVLGAPATSFLEVFLPQQMMIVLGKAMRLVSHILQQP